MRHELDGIAAPQQLASVKTLVSMTYSGAMSTTRSMLDRLPH